MPAKLLLITLAAALTAAGLLGIRQRRLETAGRMARVHEQITRNERALWELRCEIARCCRPDEVRRMIESIPVEWTTVPEPAERQGIEAEEDTLLGASVRRLRDAAGGRHNG